jgi:uncharacterized protein (TIRG00374 family)
MRIIGGTAAGLILKAPEGLGVRPTPDLVRQAIFNSLGARVSEVRVLELFGGNLGSEILFAITLAMVTRGFGYTLPLTTFLLINVVVSLFGSLIPVPGGIGVMEAGLTAGLTRAGVDSDTAFAIALSHRFITFYLPPIWGYMSYRWLIKHRFL